MKQKKIRHIPYTSYVNPIDYYRLQNSLNEKYEKSYLFRKILKYTLLTGFSFLTFGLIYKYISEDVNFDKYSDNKISKIENNIAEKIGTEDFNLVGYNINRISDDNYTLDFFGTGTTDEKQNAYLTTYKLQSSDYRKLITAINLNKKLDAKLIDNQNVIRDNSKVILDIFVNTTKEQLIKSYNLGEINNLNAPMQTYLKKEFKILSISNFSNSGETSEFFIECIVNKNIYRLKVTTNERANNFEQAVEQYIFGNCKISTIQNRSIVNNIKENETVLIN